MTLVSEDIAATRRAVHDLERRAAALARHYGDSVDAKRLLADVGRLGADLELLCGRPVTASSLPPSAPPAREVIADTSYTDGFWMDAEDEGLGRTR